MALFTPTNQKRLTNVAIVRMKRGGKRFEIACYPNKVKPWREKIETDIDEVLQSPTVFINVSKGQVAKREELLKAFDSGDQLEICKQILAKGELQVTEKERQLEKENLLRDVAKIISDKCINPDTKNCYTVTMIEKMMKDCHVTIKPNKTAKQQALDAIRQLKSDENIHIERAMMTVLLSVDKKSSKRVKEIVKNLVDSVVKEDFQNTFEMELLIEPGKLRQLEEAIQSETKGKYSLEVLSTQFEERDATEKVVSSATGGDVSEEKEDT